MEKFAHKWAAGPKWIRTHIIETKTGLKSHLDLWKCRQTPQMGLYSLHFVREMTFFPTERKQIC